jgi:6-phosphogluconolactonase (cycloisomerase 2 family)
MRSGWLRCVAVVLSSVFLLSCGSSSKSGFVYLVSQGSSPGTVTAYSLNLGSGLLKSSNGALTQTGKSANAGTQPTVLLFDPKQSFAYTANFGSADITTFTVNKDGSLAVAQASTKLTSATHPVNLAMDPGAHFLFVANEGDSTTRGNVSVFSIGPGGALTEVAGSPFAVQETSPPLPVLPVSPLPSAVAVSNQGNFVYVTDQANNAVLPFSFDPTAGALTAISGTCAGAVPCLGVVVGSAPSAVFSPAAGNFLYVANASSNDIYEFKINTSVLGTPDGSLSPITASTTIVPAGVGPIAMISDPTVKYFYVLANQGSQVIGFTFNHVTGLLTQLSTNGGTVSTGANPVGFAIRSNGTTNGNYWLFTSNNGASSISSFGLEITTGALTPLPQLTSPLAPYGIGVR